MTRTQKKSLALMAAAATTALLMAAPAYAEPLPSTPWGVPVAETRDPTYGTVYVVQTDEGPGLAMHTNQGGWALVYPNAGSVADAQALTGAVPAATVRYAANTVAPDSSELASNPFLAAGLRAGR